MALSGVLAVGLRSDVGAMSALWSPFDGAALVRNASVAFGLTGTAPPDVPGQWVRPPRRPRWWPAPADPRVPASG